MRAWVYGDPDFCLSIPNLTPVRGIYTGSDEPKQSEMETLLQAPTWGLWVVLTGRHRCTGPACSIEAVKTGREQAVGAGVLSTQAGGWAWAARRRLGVAQSALADVTLRSASNAVLPRARPY